MQWDAFAVALAAVLIYSGLQDIARAVRDHAAKRRPDRAQSSFTRWPDGYER